MEITITGYKYPTEAAAEAAVKLLNIHYGIPQSPDSVTQNYDEFEKSYTKKGTVDFYYIESDEGTAAVLGAPMELTVKITP